MNKNFGLTNAQVMEYGRIHAKGIYSINQHWNSCGGMIPGPCKCENYKNFQDSLRELFVFERIIRKGAQSSPSEIK